MDYANMLGDSFAYAKDAIVGKWKQYLLFLIATLLLTIPLMGYCLKVFRGEKPAPEVDGWGTLFIDGIKYAIISIIWAIPCIIIAIFVIGAGVLAYVENPAALMEIIGDTRVTSIDCWVIKAINVLTEDVWRYTLADLPYWYGPTTSRRDKLPNELNWNGTWREDRVLPFDDYHDQVVMWNFSNTGVLHIPKFRVQLLKYLDERPDVYVL